MRPIKILADSDKGREFTATCIGYMVAGNCWPSKGDKRPVWLQYAGTESEIKAVTANLRIGKKFEIGGGYKAPRCEMLKSAGYVYKTCRIPDPVEPLSIVTAYLPGLFELDPGFIDPLRVQFCSVVPRDWVEERISSEQQHAELFLYLRQTWLAGAFADIADHCDLRRLAALASLWMTHVFNRTKYPPIADHRFLVHAFLIALEKKLCWLWPWSPHWRSSDEFDVFVSDGLRGSSAIEFAMSNDCSQDHVGELFAHVACEYKRING
jgi:hypothetical protein